MFHDIPVDVDPTTGVKGFNAVAAAWSASAMLRAIALAPLASALLVLPAMAEQTCWPVDQVIAAHAEQGDEILLTFRSRLQDGSATIIYHDPSDGVVTEVTMHPNGTACVVDVGEGLRLQRRPQSTIARGSR